MLVMKSRLKQGLSNGATTGANLCTGGPISRMECFEEVSSRAFSFGYLCNGREVFKVLLELMLTYHDTVPCLPAECRSQRLDKCPWPFYHKSGMIA